MNKAEENISWGFLTASEGESLAIMAWSGVWQQAGMVLECS